MFRVLAGTKYLTMKRILLCIAFQLALAGSATADSNLHITDVGLNGDFGTPAAVRLLIRNPSSQPQLIHLRITASDKNDGTNSVESDVRLDGGEQRELELPILLDVGYVGVVADAGLSGTVFAHDTFEGVRSRPYLVALMCASEKVCKGTQSQIQFSGTMEEQVDKNRQLSFEVVREPRDHWWAYSAARAVVLAMPTAQFTSEQRGALEGFVRQGGRLILIENEIADSSFLSAYRRGVAPRSGEPVGKGSLICVPDLGSNTLGNAFSGANLPNFFAQFERSATNMRQAGAVGRFATIFSFPRLRWVLIWLVAYIVIIGAVNFAVLRWLHCLEFGWISMCVLAVLFAGGFYFSSASQRPKDFRLDNLATFYLDGRSLQAAADYNLRVSAPQRKGVLVSVADPAVFTYSAPIGEETNSQIWSQMNRRVQVLRQFDFRFGPPSQTELSLLKWSFQDLHMEGLRQFPGTVHLVGPNRLRNDTGQRFSEAVYLDWTTGSAYSLPTLVAGQEIQLDTISPTKIEAPNPSPFPYVAENDQNRNMTLQQLATLGALEVASQERVFAGFSDGPALPVELSVPHQENVHSLIVVAVE
jgi:hypothetical protein